MKVGLVLGGGGVIGVAYHAAALAALENDLGWDPRSAEVIVGTSAGSLVATLLRRDIRAVDLAAVTVGADPLSMPSDLAERLQERYEFPAMGLTAFLRRPRLPNLGLFTRWLRRPWRLDPFGALVSIMPDGAIDLVEHVGSIDEVLGDHWPERDLWLCAVRQRDLRRTVFGRDVHCSLADAVTASCSIPGYFSPVVIDGEPYVDGGVRSPTNADVLRHRRDLDLVVVVSPMSGRDLGRFGTESLVRRHAKGKLEAERERLHRADIPTVVIEPGPEVIEGLGLDFMSHERLEDITRAAFLDTGDQLRAPWVRTLLAGLATREVRGERVVPTAPTPADDEATAVAAGGGALHADAEPAA